MRLLRLAATAAVLLAAPAALHAQATTVIVVRHAERAAAPARDPVLTEAGQARAAALAEALAHANVQVILVTPLQRTRLTAEPLATKLGLTPQPVAITPTHVADVAWTVRDQFKGKTVLVVGHSNTVPGIVAALGGPTLPDLCDTQYSQLFMVVIPEQGAPTTVRTQYGAPDAPTAGDCTRDMRR